MRIVAEDKFWNSRHKGGLLDMAWIFQWYQTDLPMRRLPEEVRAFGSMRLHLREAWNRKRTGGTISVIYRSLGPPGRQCTGCGTGSGRRQKVLRSPGKCIGSGPGSGDRILVRAITVFWVVKSTRFRKRMANCNLNRSQSQARAESGIIHGRGNRLLLKFE